VDEGARYGLAFSDGSMDTADVVIFADGRKSFGRDALARNPLHYNGYVVWRGLARPPERLPVGFTRYYDTEVGRLFSVTSPLIQSGRSYWELSHNLSAIEWSRIAKGSPTRHAYMLPSQVNDDARSIIARYTDRLPDEFREMIDHSEVSGIPVNDVRMPDALTFRTDKGAMAILLGDAAIPPRLQVGAGLNQGLVQANELADALPADAVQQWERRALDRLGPIVELGRSRAHRINLGTYVPVSPGKTAAPHAGDAWGEPEWVTA
jgi:2-polyprenyl-6-methoxyphenol hydroxylase-like FAD-dependent oxidoreductase